MDGWLWGTWRALVGEWEVAVAHEGHVVVLMVWQERRRMMVVLIMEGRSWKAKIKNVIYLEHKPCKEKQVQKVKRLLMSSFDA